MNSLIDAFPGQERDEQMYIFARPYWVAFVPTVLAFGFIFFFSILFQFGLRAEAILPGLSPDAINAGILISGLFQLFALSVFLVALLDFYFDILIVTDRRLVDIDQEQLFFRGISELALEDVEDVRSEVKGFFQSVFHYGTVHIQTAGERMNFIVYNVRFPREITSLILDLSQQAEQDLPENKRVPHGKVVGVLEDRTYTDMAKLKSVTHRPGDHAAQ